MSSVPGDLPRLGDSYYTSKKQDFGLWKEDNITDRLYNDINIGNIPGVVLSSRTHEDLLYFQQFHFLNLQRSRNGESILSNDSRRLTARTLQNVDTEIPLSFAAKRIDDENNSNVENQINHIVEPILSNDSRCLTAITPSNVDTEIPLSFAAKKIDSENKSKVEEKTDLIFKINKNLISNLFISLNYYFKNLIEKFQYIWNIFWY